MGDNRRVSSQRSLCLWLSKSFVGDSAMDVDRFPEKRVEGHIKVPTDEGASADRARVEMRADDSLQEMNVEDGRG